MITSIIKSDAEKASRNSTPFCSDNVLKTHLPVHKAFIETMKASSTKDSKGVVVLTIPSFGGYPKISFFKFFKRQIIKRTTSRWNSRLVPFWNEPHNCITYSI